MGKLLAVAARLLLLSLLLALPAIATAQSVALQPDSGPVNTGVTATGAGWPPGWQIHAGFSLQDLPVTPVTVDSNGSFTLNFCVPNLAPGVYPTFFCPSGNPGGALCSGPIFTITVGSPGNCQPTSPQKISVEPTQGLPGSLVIVTGSGWTSGGMIDVNWGFDEQNVTSDSINDDKPGPFIARIKADDSGAFTTTVVVKNDAPHGDTYVKADDQAAGITGRANFKVLTTDTVTCADAYFIGVHGTTEGPDSLNQNQTVSETIGETWQNFYDLATKSGKRNIRGYAIDYPGPAWQVLAGAVPGLDVLIGAADQGKNKLNELFTAIQSPCLDAKVVLAGYSLGAWVIDKWIAENLSPPQAGQSAPLPYLFKSIRAVVLYGDPLWLHGIYGGIARHVGQTVTLDPYTNTPPGYTDPLAERWQSLCLANDPICGEGYPLTEWITPYWWTSHQVRDAIACISPCEHWKYMALSPKRDLVGYGSTTDGAAFLASHAFQ